MRSPAAWIGSAANVSRREMAELLACPAEILFCLYLPIIWMLVVWGLLGNGMMTRLPVGFVDMDNTSLTRDIARAFDSSRVIGLSSYLSTAEAGTDMRAGRLYGMIVIAPGYTRETLAGRGSAVELYLDESRFAVAGTIQLEAAGVMSALGLESALRSALLTGAGVAGAERMIDAAHSEIWSLGNTQDSFLAFLGGALIPGVVMVSAMLGFVTAIVRENWHGSERQWLLAADGSASAALMGKLAPHICLYAAVFLFYMALFSGQGGFFPAGSLLVWFGLGCACLAAFGGAAVFITSVAPNWRAALVVASGYAAPALPFTGFSIPLDSMGPYVRAFSYCLPLTWYIEGQTQQWTLGAAPAHMGPTFAALGILFLLPLAAGIYFFSRRFARRQKDALDKKA